MYTEEKTPIGLAAMSNLTYTQQLGRDEETKYEIKNDPAYKKAQEAAYAKAAKQWWTGLKDSKLQNCGVNEHVVEIVSLTHDELLP